MTAGGTKASVKFDAVQKSFGSVKVLEEFNLEVEPGEFLVLLGASGSGKTTALRILSGLETPSAGRVHIGDRDVTEVLPKYRDISMVFQSYALYPHKTVAENIGFPLKVKKLPRDEMDAAILDAARQVQLEALLDRYPRELSGGQRQRVALARALAREPQVLLLDEPFSAVDQVTRRRLQRELVQLRERLNIPIVLVTHDLNEASALADRLCVLHGGRTLQQGTPSELFRRPDSPEVARLLDRPNIFSGRVVDTAQGLRLGWGEWCLEVAAGLEGLDEGARVTWYLPESDIVLQRRDRPSRGVRENLVTARVDELLVLGGQSSVTLRVPHESQPLRFDISTHAARRNGLEQGAWVNVSLLAAGIHLMQADKLPALPADDHPD